MRKSACARVKGVPLFIAGDMTYHALIGGYSTRKSIERDRPARQKIPPRAREGAETPPWRQRRQQGQRRPRRQTLSISAERYATVARALKSHGAVTFFPSAITERWRCCRRGCRSVARLSGKAASR